MQTLTKREETLASKCASKNTCDHVFFTRALAALYENRETATRYFEKVIAVAPKSQLAASSRLWLQLLQSGEISENQSWVRSVLTGPASAKAHSMLSQATERAVRDLLDRELVIQQLRAMQELEAQSVETLQRELQEQEKRVESLSSRRESVRPAAEPLTVQSLQRQIGDRDRKIEELTSQLEALKRIDQEMREKIRPIKPPAAVLPVQPMEQLKP
ncbi:MAG: hypothetical protein KF814_13965 [Nitrospiraceae bacterium]|nr:hypothetical protein [Nitrospiraceae bacterium]